MYLLARSFCLFIVTFLSSAQLCFAEAPRWYEVELALISYQDAERINHENWPDILIQGTEPQQSFNDEQPWSWLTWWNETSASPEGLYNIQKNSITSSQALETPFTNSGVAFENKRERFEKYKNLQLVWNKRWRQPIPEKEHANKQENLIKIDLRSALNFAQASKSPEALIDIEISGEVFLYRSRYLHLVTDLKVQHWQSLANKSKLDKKALIFPNHKNTLENIIPSNNSTPLIAINEVPLRAAEIKQSRRMRSKELHYIDHPMLGILVRVTPILDEPNK